MRYLVAGKYKFHTHKEALAKCESIFKRTGVIASLEAL